MTKLVFLATLLWSLGAWSCPEIQGNYSCIDKYDEYELIIEREELENKLVLLTIDGVKLISDNQWRNFDGGSVRGKQRLSCIQTVAEYSILGDFVNKKGQVFGQVDLVSTMVLSRSESLLVHHQGSYVFDGAVQPIDQNVICLKK